MFLVYNFSNSNVKYSLQRMSEHIELMGVTYHQYQGIDVTATCSI